MVFAIPVSMIAIAMLAILLDRILYQPLRRKKSGTIILAMAALGASFIIQMIVLILWGADSLFYKPGVLRPALELPWEIKIRPDQIFIVLVVFISITALHLFLKYTRMGKAMRATADNPELARVTGIDTGRIIHWTWGIGGAMAAMGGILYGIDVQLHPGMGWGFLLPLFAATILGGIGNMFGALVGALVIGVAQQISTVYLLPTYKHAVAFLIIILILLIRPQGIFGGRS
jgi:branched-chain amino acid transport system permease protein/neutral amino acid transport system permease protein